MHGVLYLVLGVLCVRGLRATTSLGGARLAAAATALATIYGVTDELHQIFTPRRSSDWRDVVADGVGAAIGVLLVASRRGKTTPAV